MCGCARLPESKKVKPEPKRVKPADKPELFRTSGSLPYDLVPWEQLSDARKWAYLQVNERPHCNRGQV